MAKQHIMIENVLIQVSTDGNVWNDLVLLSNNENSYFHENISVNSTLFYRAINIADGVNYRNSDASNVVSIASGFSTEYQAVLDYCTNKASPSILIPSTQQNIINDYICRRLVETNIWDELDCFWYFKQESATSYEFLTLNWKNPIQHQLTNEGTNDVVFEADKGFSISGNNNQFFSTNFNPTTDAVNYLDGDYSLTFKLFDLPQNYSTFRRIFGGGGLIIQSLSHNSLMCRIFNSTGGSDNLGVTLNNHIEISKNTDGKKLSVDGFFQITPLDAGSSSDNSNIEIFRTGGIFSEGSFGISYLMLKSGVSQSIELSQSLNNKFQSLSTIGTKVFDAADSSLITLYFFTIYKSVDFPSLNTSKKYIILYSTDHAQGGPNDGACAWGEADFLDFRDFAEKGEIIRGYQSETPFLRLVPDDPDGDVIHVTYHPVSHPDSLGGQQTRLLTRAGGDLHDQTGWTDRGEILGIINQHTTENHTGYLTAYRNTDGTFTAIHSTKGIAGTTASGIPKIGISTIAVDGRSATRVTSSFDVSAFMPGIDRQFHITPALYFERNNKQYCVARNAPFDFDTDLTTLCVVECDGNYQPTTYIQDISLRDGGYPNTNAGYYIDSDDPDTLHIYYVLNQTELYHSTWDLRNLD